MIFVFKVSSPALPSGAPVSDLDGDEWTFQDQSLANATKRAHRRLDQTFAYASEERRRATSIAFVSEYPSRKAYEAAQESGVSLTASDVDTVLACVLADDLKAVGS